MACEIQKLIAKPFSERSDVEKYEILKRGRPTGDILEQQEETCHGVRHTRTFKRSWYEANDWLAGSSELNKLFCWPCLLVSNRKDVWSSKGFLDLKNLSRGLLRHSNCKVHIQCQVGLRRLENESFPSDELLTEQARMCKSQYNEYVNQNRELLKRLVEATVLLLKQDLVFLERDNADGSDEGVHFKELFFHLIRHKGDLKSHCDQLGSIFTELMKTIQHELIECLDEEITKFVRNEITETDCFSIQVDDASDVTQKAQSSIIIRFVDKSGDTQERFLGFYDVIEDKKLCGLNDVLDSVLSRYSYSTKLIAQCYDGASVMADALMLLHTKVRKAAPEALFVHCADHRLNLVLQQGASCISETRLFFSAVQSFCSFFHQPSIRSTVLKEILVKRIPTHVCWCSDSSLLSFMLHEHSNLMLVFEDITAERNIANDTRIKAFGYLEMLRDFHFMFLLIVFSPLFQVTSTLFKMLETKIFDVNYCHLQVTLALEKISGTRNDTAAALITEQTLRLTGPPSRRNIEHLQDNYQKMYFKIIDNICTQIRTRFSGIKDLQFFQLVDTTKYEMYAEQSIFPRDAFASLRKSYPSQFDFSRLKSELEVVYGDKRFRDISFSKSIKLIVDGKLQSILPEALKLFTLIETIPPMSASSDRSDSCLKRIKSRVRSTMTQERLAELSTSSIESHLLVQLESRPSWYDDVINRFAKKKDRRIDLLHQIS